MVAAGLNAGAGMRKGYDEDSFLQAIRKSDSGWKLRLRGEPVLTGSATGRVLGGCMTLLEATIGTPWELVTKDSILVLEDRAMKPYQVDRVLMHLKQAGKFEGVRFRWASRRDWMLMGKALSNFWNRRWWLERNEACACDWDWRIGDGAAGRDAARARLSRYRVGFRSLPTGFDAARKPGNLVFQYI
jgi:hypothetical protein